MIAPINLHPPKNWQDFETLCLKLWGELWEIPHEIELNSDNSQGQHGVDIYGPVDGGKAYMGVQCKNRKLNLIDGSRNRLKESDIDAEIKKAVQFKPSLKKLVIATSLQKDGKIEEYVRMKSVENVEAGLFTVQICFWDFFELKLPECQKVYDWYLKHESFQRVRALSVTFEGGGESLVVHPKYQMDIDQYVLGDVEQKLEVEEIDMLARFNPFPGVNPIFKPAIIPSFETTVDWHQYMWFRLRLSNVGQAVIEDFILELDFDGEVEEAGAREPANLLLNKSFKTDVKVYSNTKLSLYVEPFEKHIVQKYSYTTDKMYVETKLVKQGVIKIKWRLLSRDFDDDGELSINISPKYRKVLKQHLVSVPDEVREVETISYVRRRMTTGNPLGNTWIDKEEDFKFE